VSRVDPPGSKWSALVVDDDPGLQGLFNALLTKDGFAVDLASTGRQAFELLRRGSYSVIFLDLMMPDVNGFELLDRLERDSPTLLRRVIVMTGASLRMIETVDTSLVYGFIRKPFDIHDVIRSAKSCAAGQPRFERRESRVEQRA
jgi:DNA-binding NtrC family response regulator